MKKISLLVALAIILAVAAPVFAGSFSDVPENHWAYEALNKVAATGIVTGYADGTFKGKNTLTRYEIAVIVSRILDKVAAERALLAEKVDALENGLTAGQAEDTIAIFKSLLAKEREKMIAEIMASLPEQPAQTGTTTVVETKTEVVLPENLTEQQAAEVAAIVEALSMEFKFELEAIGARIDALEADVDGRLVALEGTTHSHNISWSGEYNVTVNKTNITGATAYKNPFKTDFDGNKKNEAGKDWYTAKDIVEHSLTLNMGVKTDNLAADFELATVVDPFAVAETAGVVTLADLFGTVTGDNFTATIGREQKNVMAPYLFGLNGTNDKYTGIKVAIGNNNYVLFKDAANKDALAIQQGLGLLNSTLYLGTADVVDSADFLVGLNVPVSFIGVDVTADVAAEQVAAKLNKYVTVNAKTGFGPLSIVGNYTMNKDGFAGIYAKGIKADGYDVSADMTLLGDKVSVNANYENYAIDNYGFGANAAFGPVTAKFDMDFNKQDSDSAESNSTEYGAELNTKLAILGVVAGYDYYQYTDAITGIYVDDDGVALDELNRVYSDLSADLFIPGLTASASYVYGLKDDVDGTGLTTHEYGVAYENSILAAGFNYDVAGKAADANAEVAISIFTVGIEREIIGGSDMTVWAGVNPAAYTVMGVSVDTIAGFKMNNDGTATAYNYNVGVDVKKALNDKSNFTYGFVYDNREIAATGALTGLVKKHTAAVDYAITSDLTATLSYTDLDFDGTVAAESYKAQELKTGLSLAF